MAVNVNEILPWVGWEAGRLSFVLTTPEKFGRKAVQKPVAAEDMFVEVTRLAWERYANLEDWKSGAALGKICAEKRPELAYGWENWAWALHKCGETKRAYKLLTPFLKKLKLAGPPSGRAAYCVACFCATLGKNAESLKWLRLAYALACDKDVFKRHVIHEPDLREIWPGLPQLSEAAFTALE